MKKKIKKIGAWIYKTLSWAWGHPIGHPALFIGIILLSYTLFGGWGIIGLIIAEIFVALFIVILRWEIYMNAIRMFEINIWGRPLDKKYDHLPKNKLKFSLKGFFKYKKEDKNETRSTAKE